MEKEALKYTVAELENLKGQEIVVQFIFDPQKKKEKYWHGLTGTLLDFRIGDNPPGIPSALIFKLNEQSQHVAEVEGLDIKEDIAITQIRNIKTKD